MPGGRNLHPGRERRLLAVLAGAAVVRLWLLTTPALRLEGDEAVTGIMARRILEGHHRAYYAGQDYMGTAEQYLQAGALALLPDGDVTLRLPQVGLAVLSCLLVHRVAVRCGLSRDRALLAAALFAAGPYFPAYWGTKSRGAYAVAVVLGLAGLLVALWVEPADRRRLPKVALFGLVAGIAVWCNQQAAYLLVPAAWWLLATVRPRWRSSLLAGAAGFVLGAAPALWHTLAGGPGPFSNHEGDNAVAERAQHLLAQTLPDLLGVRDDGAPLVAWLPPAFVVLVAVAALGAAVSSRRDGLVGILRLRTEERRGLDLLVLVLVLLPVLYVQSAAATIATTRYVIVLFGVLPILAASLPTPRAIVRSPGDAQVAGLLLVLAFGLHTVVGAGNLIAQDDGGHEAAAGQIVVPDDLDPVVDALVAAGARTAYADYWLAWPLTWRADGRVVVESLQTRRFPHVSRTVDADPSPALVIADGEVGAVTDALRRRGASFTIEAVVGWWVITGIEPGIHLPPTGSVLEGLGSS